MLGVDRELRPNLAVQVNYTYTRVSNLFGNLFANITPRVGVAPGVNGNYTRGSGFSGTLPDGTPYSVATYIPNPALVTAGGSGFLLTNVPGYYTDNHGLEVARRQAADRQVDGTAGALATTTRASISTIRTGSTTPTGTRRRRSREPLVDGGAFAPQSSGNGQGAIYINARWQFNANGMYQAPYGIELAANVFGRQGYPEPLFRPGSTAALGADSSLNVLVSPTFDYVRYPNVWDTDIRVAREFKFNAISLPRHVRRLQPVQRQHGARAQRQHHRRPRFNQLAQNLSPRIARIGVQIGF